MSGNNVRLEVDGGPSTEVPWAEKMTAQDLLEAAYENLKSEKFTYALQYYGQSLGYLVLMINETYDTFMSAGQPFFYWEFFLNDVPAQSGIDNVRLEPGNTVRFSYVIYDPAKHAATPLAAKHAKRLASV